jgi:hypothetical protein
LVVGVSPAAAGVALIPATLPIILAGPSAGKAFDRYGGRWPPDDGALCRSVGDKRRSGDYRDFPNRGVEVVGMRQQTRSRIADGLDSARQRPAAAAGRATA